MMVNGLAVYCKRKTIFFEPKFFTLMNLNITSRLATLVLVLMICCATSWANTNDHSGTTETTTSCDLSFTTELIGVFCNEDRGNIVVNITGGTAPFKIEWDNNDFSIWAEVEIAGDSYTITGLPTGFYKIQVRDAFGCLQKQDVFLRDQESTMDLTVTNNSSACDVEGSIAVVVGNSSPPYWVILDGPTPQGHIINDNVFTLDGLEGGDYTIKVRKEKCEATSTIKVTTNAAALALEVQEIASCAGSSAAVATNITGGHPNYRLYVDGPTSVLTHSNGPKLVQNLEPGTYNFTVIDQEGCTISQEVEVGLKIHDDIFFDTEVYPGECGEAGHILVQEMDGAAPFELSWQGPRSSTVVMNLGDSDAYDIIDLPGGIYEIRIRDVFGCIFEQIVELDESVNDMRFDVDAQDGQCGTSGFITVHSMNGTAPYQVQWTGPVSNSATIEQAGNYDIRDLPAGTYQIVISDANGCTFAQPVTIQGGGSDVSMTSEATANLCNQTGDIWVTPAGGTGSYTLTWSGPTQGSVGIGTNGYSIIGVPSGKYHLTVTDQNGCSASNEVEFNITTALLRFDLSSANAINGQNGSIHIAFVNGAQPYVVSWVGPVSNSIVTNGPNYDITNLPSGTYSITVTDSNGCFYSQQITIANTARNTNLNFSAEPSDQVGSIGGSIRVLILQGDGPYTVSWSGPSSGSIVTNDIENFLRNLSAGIYTITVSDSDGNYGRQTVVIGFQEARVFAINVGVSNSVCGVNGSIDASWENGVPPYQVSWTGSSSGGITTNSTSHNASVPAGSYIVTITDATGVSRSAAANVGVSNGTLYCSLDPMNTMCTANGSILVIINGGTLPYQLRWEGPSSGAVTVTDDFRIPNLPAGAYTTFLSDAGGCDITESAVVGVSPSNLGLTINGGDGKVDFLFGSGTPNYNITLSGPRTISQVAGGNTTISGLIAGLYRATIVDANGCSISQLVRVTGDNVAIGETQLVSNNLTSNLANSAGRKSLEKLENRPILTLNQNYPNPSSTFTTIPFNLVETMNVNMTIQDRFGKIVKEVNQTFYAGDNQIEINGNDLPTGIYYYTLIVGAEMQTKRMVIAH